MGRLFLSKGEPFEVNLRIIRANDGEIRYINARGGPLLDDRGAMIKLTGTTFDITRWVGDGAPPRQGIAAGKGGL